MLWADGYGLHKKRRVKRHAQRDALTCSKVAQVKSRDVSRIASRAYSLTQQHVFLKKIHIYFVYLATYLQVGTCAAIL